MILPYRLWENPLRINSKVLKRVIDNEMFFLNTKVRKKLCTTMYKKHRAFVLTPKSVFIYKVHQI